MSKTRISRPRSRRLNNSMKHHIMQMHTGCCEATFHGLNQWYTMEFEKLGWMILAKHRGYNDKIVSYLNSLMRLQEALEHKLTHLKESDRKEDVEIMLNNLAVLIEHANHDLR